MRWQGLTAETLAARNGHKKIVQIIQEELNYRAAHPEEFPNHNPTRQENDRSHHDHGKFQKHNNVQVPTVSRRKSSLIPKPNKTVLVKKAKEPKVETEVVSSGVGDSEDWRSEFECPVCLEMMWTGVQIYQCVSGNDLTVG